MRLLLITFVSFIEIILSFDNRIKGYKYSLEQPEPKEIFYSTYHPPLDHFRPQNEITRDFYYSYTTDFYEPGGPIFFHVSDMNMYGNEFLPLYGGIVNEVAQQVNGAIVVGDIRYFWNQIVFPTISFEDMTYLTIDQIMGDITLIITDVKERLNAPNAKVFVFGGGIGGTIETWLRIKFPHIINGVWSSSGIFSADLFTDEPYKQLSEVIENAGNLCSSRTREAFDEITELIAADEGDYLQEIFHLCSSVNTTSELDIQTFFEGQLNFISDFFSNLHENAESDFCNFLEYSNRSALDGFVEWYTTYNYEGFCIELSYENRTALFAFDTLYGSMALPRLWYYLQCTQLGMHKTTLESDTIFSAYISHNYHYNVCQDVLGVNYTFETLSSQVDRLFIEYGGKNPAITHAIFTNGLNDPWLTHGILEFNQPDSYVFNITDVGRSADIFAYNVRPSLTPIWESIREILISWSLE